MNIYAGGKANSSTSSYLVENATNNSWWTITPASYINVDPNTVFAVDANGKLYDTVGGPISENTTFGLRPAVSLVSGIQISGGIGTISNPYIIKN